MIHRDHVLQFCAELSWHPGLRNYDLYGVTLTALYAVATGFAATRARQRGGWFWTLAAAYLLLLTLNKQLDLQTFLTQTGRCVARYQGWYGERRIAQADVAYVIAGLMAAAFAATVTLIRVNRLMVTGLALITAFLALRILSFHNTDILLQLPLYGYPLYQFIEMSSVLLLIYAAAT